MGIEFHHRIGVEKLRKLVNARLNGETEEEDTEDYGDDDASDFDSDMAKKDEPSIQVSKQAKLIEKAKKPVDLRKPVESKQQRRNRLRREALKLVRVRVTNMNPNKSAHEGEIYTVSNSVIGTVRRYVPFNVPWHVEKIILNALKERTYMHFVTVKDNRGNKTKQTRIAKELSIEELNPLNDEELDKLAQRQMARASNED